MFSPLRNRFGIPGVISVIALVFAMFGGAYAATNDGGSDSATASAKKNKRAAKRRAKKRAAGLNAKQKRQVIALAKRFAGAGPQGPVGPAGPAGSAGAKGDKGDAGANGSNGSNGSNGVSATVAEEAPGAECPEGGIKVSSASPDAYVCNGEEGAEGPPGEDGSPWTVGGVLPPGETLTGAWAFGLEEQTTFNVPISFPIPLAAELAASDTHAITKAIEQEKFGAGAGEACEGKTGAALESCEEAAEGAKAACAGSGANPTAVDGHLCVYVGEFLSAKFGASPIKKAGSPTLLGGAGASKAGAMLQFSATGFAFGNGTWAVTAPTP